MAVLFIGRSPLLIPGRRLNGRLYRPQGRVGFQGAGYSDSSIYRSVETPIFRRIVKPFVPAYTPYYIRVLRA